MIDRATPRLYSIKEARRAIQAGEILPSELVDLVLERVASAERDVGAFAHLEVEAVRTEARRLDERPRIGGLFGIPFAVKDVIDVAGMPTRAGSAVLSRAGDATADADVVASIRDDGAIILGKTATHEFAMGTVTPDTRNPHRLNHIAGGSSGGSAAAVAAGFTLGALGTDTGGSVRIPAALCGVVGLKPRSSSVSTRGVIPLSPIADSCGPIARTVDDVARIWSAIGSPLNRRVEVSALGWVHPDDLGPLSDEVAAAYDHAVAALGTRAGLQLSRARLPHVDEWYPVRLTPLYADASRVHREHGWYPDHSELYSPGLRSVLDRGAARDAGEVLDAWKGISVLAERVLEALVRVDALILPTTPIAAPLRGGDVDEAERTELTAVSQTLTRLCAPFNWAPVAAVSVPFGTTSKGLPIGMQIVARDEATALHAASLVEACAPRDDTISF